MDIKLICIILLAHFIGDFLLQNDWMATNKSKNPRALLAHVIMYSLPLLLVGGIYWVILNFSLHLLVDFTTSKITAYLWKEENRHWFFVVIGADQYIHAVTLLCTYNFYSAL